MLGRIVCDDGRAVGGCCGGDAVRATCGAVGAKRAGRGKVPVRSKKCGRGARAASKAPTPLHEAKPADAASGWPAAGGSEATEAEGVGVGWVERAGAGEARGVGRTVDEKAARDADWAMVRSWSCCCSRMEAAMSRGIAAAGMGTIGGSSALAALAAVPGGTGAETEAASEARTADVPGGGGEREVGEVTTELTRASTGGAGRAGSGGRSLGSGMDRVKWARCERSR